MLVLTWGHRMYRASTPSRGKKRSNCGPTHWPVLWPGRRRPGSNSPVGLTRYITAYRCSQSEIRDFGGSDCAAETEKGGGDHDNDWAADKVHHRSHERRYNELCYEYHAAHLHTAKPTDRSSHDVPHEKILSKLEPPLLEAKLAGWQSQ